MGSKPNLDDVRRLAEQMSTGNYPRKEEPPATRPSSVHAQPSRSSEKESLAPDSLEKKKGRGLKKKLFGSFRSGGGPGSASGVSGVQHHHEQQSGPATGSQPSANTGPVAPEHDASAHSNMESMLESAAQSSAPVNAKGIKSNDTLLTRYIT